jgi:hypothetical protein
VGARTLKPKTGLRVRDGISVSDQVNIMANIQQQVKEPIQQPVNLRQHVAALLSPAAQRVLDLRYQEMPPAVIIACLGVPCAMVPTPDRTMWQFACPWWQTLLPEDSLFEARLLTEVGKVKQHVDGMLQNVDLSRVN